MVRGTREWRPDKAALAFDLTAAQIRYEMKRPAADRSEYEILTVSEQKKLADWCIQSARNMNPGRS